MGTTDQPWRLTVDEFRKAGKLPVIIVLDNIRSMSNTGSVFRTADAFRLEGIHLCGITATPPHREIHKTALGATDSVQWTYYPDTTRSVGELRSKGYRIIAVEQTPRSIPLQTFRPVNGERLALVFGNEIHGVNQHLTEEADLCVEIPQFGTKHSLNIAVSVGIVIWEIIRSPVFFRIL